MSLKKLITSKRFFIIGSFVTFVFIIVIYNLSFAAFSNRQEKEVANIKVAGMSYNFQINGEEKTQITIGSGTTIYNLEITSLNKRDSKYELIYDVCSDVTCTNLINKPNDLKVEYSSRTIDPISGIIGEDSSKQIRIAVTNTGSSTYYLKLGINAGFVYNTLALRNLIASEYNEEDLIIIATIGDTISQTFPTNGNYAATVNCTTNGGSSVATGTATWNGNKWVVNISNLDTSKTTCHVYFKNTPEHWDSSSQGTLLYALKTGNTINNPLTVPGKQASRSDEAIIAQAIDDYGITYYFRGAVQNNYLVFAGMCWRIVRVTGSGAIKLTLFNYNPNSVTNPCDTSQDGSSNAYARHNGAQYGAAFNTSYAYNAYIGYMYGGAGSTSYANEHANNNKSVILQRLETWYNSKLASHGNYLADTIWCNDKSIDTVNVFGTTLGYGSNKTGYSARTRINGNGNPSVNANPSLVCPNDSNGGKLSKFTVDDTTSGNGNLIYKIGLLTADEIAFAGGAYMIGNTSYYLYKNATEAYWWTMTPMMYESGNAYNFYIYVDGIINYGYVAASFALRPAISLVHTTTVTGSGTSSNPYMVTGY